MVQLFKKNGAPHVHIRVSSLCMLGIIKSTLDEHIDNDDALDEAIGEIFELAIPKIKKDFTISIKEIDNVKANYHEGLSDLEQIHYVIEVLRIDGDVLVDKEVAHMASVLIGHIQEERRNAK